MSVEEQRIVEELGRTQTVKDVEAVYRAILEGQRQLAVRLRHARQRKEKIQAELETFYDDLRQITGLPLDSPLLQKIASLTLARRLARRYLQQAEAENDFPNGW
jgi:hypothetical protein